NSKKKPALCASTNGNDGDNNDKAATASFLPRIIQTRGVPLHIYPDKLETSALKQSIRLDWRKVQCPSIMSASWQMDTWEKVSRLERYSPANKYVCPNAVGVGTILNEIQQKKKERIPTGLNQHSTIPPERCESLTRSQLTSSPPIF
ncbi:hypothetical protein (Partial), partial [Seminavis robusta]